MQLLWLSIEIESGHKIYRQLLLLFNFVVDQIERFKGGSLVFSVLYISLNFQPLEKQSVVWCLAFFVVVIFKAWPVTFNVTNLMSVLRLEHLRQSHALFKLNRVDSPFYGSSILFCIFSYARIPFTNIYRQRATWVSFVTRCPTRQLIFYWGKHDFNRRRLCTFQLLIKAELPLDFGHLIYEKEIEIIGLKIRLIARFLLFAIP